MIDVTARAVELLAKAGAAARRFDPDACVRVVRDGGAVRFELADGPGPDDVAIERPEVTFYVGAGLDGIIDVEDPHDRLVLRTADPSR
jgi:hypothetical protein